MEKTTLTLTEIARLAHRFDAQLRAGLSQGRTGLFRRRDGTIYVRQEIAFGDYPDEVIQIFGDETDLDLFYQYYLKSS